MGNAISSMSTSKDSGYDKWQAADDLRTVQEAKRIQGDTKRMAGVRRAAKEKLSEMESLKTLAAGKS
jgi:hypothetical protein